MHNLFLSNLYICSSYSTMSRMHIENIQAHFYSILYREMNRSRSSIADVAAQRRNDYPWDTNPTISR